VETLKLLLERADAVNKYWNLYIAVSLGVIGVSQAIKGDGSFSALRILLALGFVIFAISNLLAIRSINAQRMQISMLVEDPYKNIANLGRPPSEFVFLCFHAGIDVAVVLSILLLHG
jgi:hypothetical protein